MVKVGKVVLVVIMSAGLVVLAYFFYSGWNEEVKERKVKEKTEAERVLALPKNPQQATAPVRVARVATDWKWYDAPALGRGQLTFPEYVGGWRAETEFIITPDGKNEEQYVDYIDGKKVKGVLQFPDGVFKLSSKLNRPISFKVRFIPE